MWIMIVFLAVRVILLMISVKYLKVCKYYIFLYTLIISLDFYHPIEIDFANQAWILSLTNIIIFILFYFEFWSSLFCNLATQILLVVARRYIYHDAIDSVVITWTIFNLLWTCFFCAIIHLVITQVGFTYVKAEILRSGNE